jgi:hypothetical protein
MAEGPTRGFLGCVAQVPTPRAALHHVVTGPRTDVNPKMHWEKYHLGAFCAQQSYLRSHRLRLLGSRPKRDDHLGTRFGHGTIRS